MVGRYERHIVKIRRGVAYDNDGGALCFEPAHTGDESTLGTGKISLIGTTNPKLIFSYGRKNFPDTKLIVFAQRQTAPGTELKSDRLLSNKWQSGMV